MSRFHLVRDGFSADAKALRGVFDERFADPRSTRADRFVWDYWHVPNQYTLLRTPAWEYFPEPLYERFHEALVLWGDDVEVMFASHHWPTWGNERIQDYLEKQRDTYKYIHDQTMRLANSGATPREIAEQLELPPSLARDFAVRGYYGSVSHNSKAVYQHYFGWFDGNPAHLEPVSYTHLRAHET